MAKRVTGWVVLAVLFAAAVLYAVFETQPSQAASVKKGAPKRHVYSAKFAISGPSTPVAVTNLNLVQLHLDSETQVGPDQFTTNATSDLMCNPSTAVITQIEVTFTAQIIRTSAGQTQFYRIAGAQCLDCQSDPFPQLVDGDEMPFAADIFIQLSNTISGQSVTVVTNIALEAGACIGVMAEALDAGGVGDTLAIARGGIMMNFTR